MNHWNLRLGGRKRKKEAKYQTQKGIAENFPKVVKSINPRNQKAK